MNNGRYNRLDWCDSQQIQKIFNMKFVKLMVSEDRNEGGGGVVV